MSYNLQTRVERLERQRSASPYEQMSDEELQSRLDHLHRQLSTGYGFNTRAMEIAELRWWIDVDERHDGASGNALLEEFRRKYGPPQMSP